VWVAVVVVVIAAVAIVVGVAWPLLARPEAPAEAPDAVARRRKALEDDLERAVEAIREIAQDHRSGALSDEDFETLDRDERQRAVEIMRRIDAIDGTPPAARSGEERAAGTGRAGTNS